MPNPKGVLVDGQFVKVDLEIGAPEEKIFFVPPEEGPVKISCSDDKGRNSDLVIQVKYF